MSYSGNTGAAQEVVSQIEVAGGSALPVKAGGSDAVATKTMFDEAERHGTLAALVNKNRRYEARAAGRCRRGRFDQQIAINLNGW